MYMEIKKHKQTEKHTAFALIILFNFAIQMTTPQEFKMLKKNE